jgi:DNA-3-methyladenine glycosylase II
MKRLEHRHDLEEAVACLVKAEPRFGLIMEHHGLPPLRQVEPGLKSLLHIVTYQLISLKAGDAIWSCIIAHLNCFTPNEILACSENELRALGLSGAKARTFHAAARAFQAGAFSQDTVLKLTEQELTERLTDIRGVGSWTANLYLLTVYRIADAWPAADVALQHAAHHLFGLPRRPSAVELTQLAEPWRPCRSAAALLLWSHYRGLRGLPQR